VCVKRAYLPPCCDAIGDTLKAQQPDASTAFSSGKQFVTTVKHVMRRAPVLVNIAVIVKVGRAFDVEYRQCDRGWIRGTSAPRIQTVSRDLQSYVHSRGSTEPWGDAAIPRTRRAPKAQSVQLAIHRRDGRHALTQRGCGVRDFDRVVRAVHPVEQESARIADVPNVVGAFCRRTE
jgi:hypothetical protein